MATCSFGHLAVYPPLFLFDPKWPPISYEVYSFCMGHYIGNRVSFVKYPLAYALNASVFAARIACGQERLYTVSCWREHMKRNIREENTAFLGCVPNGTLFPYIIVHYFWPG